MSGIVALVVGLIVIGLCLALVEVFVIPGMGIAALLALAALAGAVVIAFWKLSTSAGLAAVGGGFGVVVLAVWLLPKTKAARAMVLQAQHTGRAANQALQELIGKEGVVVGPLRPAGSVDIDGKLVDVVSDGEYVERGVHVRVLRIEGARVLVEPLNP